MHLRVRVGSEHYAIDIAAVREVDRMETLTPVPGAPPAVLGVRNLRGTIIPVLDLAAILNVARQGAPAALAVVEEGQRLAGLAIDEPLEVGEMKGSPQPTESPFLMGALLSEGSFVGLLDLPAVLAKIEADGVR